MLPMNWPFCFVIGYRLGGFVLNRCVAITVCVLLKGTGRSQKLQGGEDDGRGPSQALVLLVPRCCWNRALHCELSEGRFQVVILLVHMFFRPPSRLSR